MIRSNKINALLTPECITQELIMGNGIVTINLN